MTCTECGKSKPLDTYRKCSHCRARNRKNSVAYRARKRGDGVCTHGVSLQYSCARCADDAVYRSDPKLADLPPAEYPTEYEALKPADFDVGSLNPGERDPRADKEKKQEYSRADGEFLDLLRKSGGDPAKMPEPEASKSAFYTAVKSEQERRFQNRRLARSASIQAANEALNLRMMMQLAKDYFWDKTAPSGYALKTQSSNQDRAAVILLSDLHFRSDLQALDNPIPYGAEEESRCMGKIVTEVAEFKSQYRDHTYLQVLLNGDLIDGMLLHDLRDGAPLPEQVGAFLSYLRSALAVWASVYPRVEVECQPGNHGRDKLRHPGRATSSKWQGHEWLMMYCLSQMCAGLPNVHFKNPFQAVSTVDLFGNKLLLSHGDTEIKLGDPDSKARDNEAALSKVNSTRIYGPEYVVGCFGHFHKARYFPWKTMKTLFNAALTPPNGHARTEGYINERRGQWLFEATKDYPLGDMRFLEVNEQTDRDAALNKVVAPFAFGR